MASARSNLLLVLTLTAVASAALIASLTLALAPPRFEEGGQVFLLTPREISYVKVDGTIRQTPNG
jgi:hypothetical protein